MSKAWTVGEIRTLARQTVDGRHQIATARGAYFRALVETTQAELGCKSGQDGQLAAVRAVHRKFYPVVQEATTTEDIAHSPKSAPAERKRRALERNRRTNFARSAYGTIRRWLRAEGNDLMKLDSQKVTKSQLLSEAPPTRKHALTSKRIKARAGKLTDSLLGFARQIAKSDPEQAAVIAAAAIAQLSRLVPATSSGKKHWPTDTQVLRRERLKKVA